MNGTMNSLNATRNEHGLLPYSVIVAATKGDPESMTMVIRHYSSQMDYLSMRKLCDDRGNFYYGTDQDIKDRLQSKLMKAVLVFKI